MASAWGSVHRPGRPRSNPGLDSPNRGNPGLGNPGLGPRPRPEPPAPVHPPGATASELAPRLRRPRPPTPRLTPEIPFAWRAPALPAVAGRGGRRPSIPPVRRPEPGPPGQKSEDSSQRSGQTANRLCRPDFWLLASALSEGGGGHPPRHRPGSDVACRPAVRNNRHIRKRLLRRISEWDGYAGYVGDCGLADQGFWEGSRRQKSEIRGQRSKTVSD